MDRALEALVWERSRSCCEYCVLPARLAEAAFQIDHIIAKKHGGETTAANLALSCYPCNTVYAKRAAALARAKGTVGQLGAAAPDRFIVAEFAL